MSRVLIDDDSPVARVVLKKMVNASPGMEVVGSANDGKEALAAIPRLQPHVVCTDLHMPRMDGLSLTREIMSRHPLPILVVSVSVHQDSNDQNIFELLEAGAIDVFPKPRGGLESASAALTHELAAKIKILAGVVPIRRHSRNVARPVGSAPSPPSPCISSPTNKHVLPTSGLSGARPAMVAIGASTGGPQALLTILSALPARFPLPIICVQHISHGFLDEMVSWLNSHTLLLVQVAKSGDKPLPGYIYFPQEDKHLEITDSGRFSLVAGKEKDTHRPAVDATFQSLARIYEGGSIAVLLTGMGRDGADGMLAVSRAKGVTIAQDEESCVVFGMPKQAIDLGAVSEVLPVVDIAPALCRLAGMSVTTGKQGVQL